jgi:hypothetical protein
MCVCVCVCAMMHLWGRKTSLLSQVVSGYSTTHRSSCILSSFMHAIGIFLQFTLKSYRKHFVQIAEPLNIYFYFSKFSNRPSKSLEIIEAIFLIFIYTYFPTKFRLNPTVVRKTFLQHLRCIYCGKQGSCFGI